MVYCCVVCAIITNNLINKKIVLACEPEFLIIKNKFKFKS